MGKLMAALDVLKMVRLATMGRRRRRRPLGEQSTGTDRYAREEAVRNALKELHRGGVNVDRAPQEAVEMVIDAALPPEDHPALRQRGEGGSVRDRSRPDFRRMVANDVGPDLTSASWLNEPL